MAARRFFDTPLLFSVQEAKGLEYENVILVNFISNERANFSEIINGVNPDDLGGDLEGDLEYRRARDKTDKTLEAYKFYVNSLYVAITRAVRRLYLIESDTGHPLIRMLGIKDLRETAAIEMKQSSLGDWQAEARRLELQGKQEQADQIRREILKTQPIPWEVCTPEKVTELLDHARNKKEAQQKPLKTLFEYALFHDEPMLMRTLSAQGFFDKAGRIYYSKDGELLLNHSLYKQWKMQLSGQYLQRYSGSFFKDIIRECELYGVDHRNVFNKTPLMMAARAGNAALVRELLSAGADTDLADNYGLTAWQWALQRIIEDKKFSQAGFPAVHELLAPSMVSLKVDGRLAKIDRRQGEFLLFNIFFAAFGSLISRGYTAFFDGCADIIPLPAVAVADIVESLPGSVIPDYRKKRTYISGLLSKNELDSANPYGKKLFVRKNRGHYILNPGLSIRQKEDWIDIYDHANIRLTMSFCGDDDRHFLEEVISLLSCPAHGISKPRNDQTGQTN